MMQSSSEGLSATSVAILDATLAVIGRNGLARLALEDVAAEAGVSRQTVYRHFGSRDGLLSAVIVREEEEMLVRVFEASDGIDDVEEAIAVGLVAAFAAADAHPLLNRLLQSEPEALLPFLTAASGPVLSIVGPTVMQVVTERTNVPETDMELLGEAVGRLVVSYAISPSPYADRETIARRIARMVADHIAAITG